MGKFKWLAVFLLIALILSPVAFAQDDDAEDEDDDLPKVDVGLKGAKVGAKTDDEVVSREEQAMSSDGYNVSEMKLLREQAEKFTFQAEVTKVMQILINSIYTNKEIFLRELISNASDALDKIRFTALTDSSLLGEGDQAKLEIKIKIDKEHNTLTITDRGIGMTKDELVKNLGTIAQSGTSEFLKKFTDGDKTSSNLIGQFGVGFYSSYLVADTVTVTSKNNNDEQYVWTSAADGSFTVAKDPKGNTLGRGTRITLHLKEDATEFLDESKIREVAKRYSEFINFPIYLYASKTVEKEVPVEPEEKETPEKETTEETNVEDEEEDEEEDKPTTKKVSETVWEWELLNNTKPIWTRSTKDVTEDEYKDFFKAITKESTDPLKWIHFSAEGDNDFRSILYIPGTAPHNMFDPSAQAHRGSIKLFVRRVFITDEFQTLVPNYLRFIRGIVDSDDLPLNVSREMLQQNKILKQIEKKLVRKSIAMFQELSKDQDQYKKFWENYGTNVKLGVIEDAGNRSRLIKLLQFHSSKTGELTTFDDYVSRMKEGQDQIFYLAGSNMDNIKKSPLLESAIKKGYEVLYMVDPIDEYALQHIQKYDSKHKLTNLGKEGVKFDEADAEEEKKNIDAEFKPLADFLKKTLEKDVEKVIISDRLTTSPCALVASTYGYSANMERILKAQALGANQKNAPPSKKILEINPRHPIIIELLRRSQGDETEQEAAKVSSTVLFETAVLSSGYTVEDPANFAKWIHKMMSINLGTEVDVPEEALPVIEETATPTGTTEPIIDNNNNKDEL